MPIFDYECVKCFTRYFPNEFFSRGNVLGKKRLFYWLGFRQLYICEYGNLLDAVDGKLTKLPWLDFNITPEKLKLYTIYSPAEHIDGTIRATKDQALLEPEEFDGKTTE